MNRLSEKHESDHAWLEEVNYANGLEGFTPPDGADPESYTIATLDSLRNIGLISPARSSDLTVRASYQGLAWEHRRKYTADVGQLDELIANGETATVEFKRRLEIKSRTSKREFAKDVAALANTKATGRRFILVGVDDDGRIHRAINPADKSEHDRSIRKISQDRLQQVLNDATKPVVTVRYDVIDRPDGLVGRLEVLRDRSNVPYSVSNGDQRTVYVRREAVTQQASPEEIEEMQERSAWAKMRGK